MTVEAMKKIESKKFGVVRFAGEVQAIDQKQGHNGTYYITTILVPAATTKDYPKRFPIFSQQKFGNIGQDIEVTCEVQSRWNKGFLNVSLAALLD